MAVICPTVTATDPRDFSAQMERAAQFASRVHIDLMDGKFAPTTSPPLDGVWWPDALIADVHLMYEDFARHLEAMIKLKPNLVIVHAEVVKKGNFKAFIEGLQTRGIKVGLGLLPETSPVGVAELLLNVQHALIFSGKLGFHGGVADLGLLDKARMLREINPNLEIGWDGGVNADNAKQLVAGGVDVLNVGGFVQSAEDPAANYQKLVSRL